MLHQLIHGFSADLLYIGFMSKLDKHSNYSKVVSNPSGFRIAAIYESWAAA